MPDIIKLKTGDKVVFPHCSDTYEDEERVEDFVIPKRLGSESAANEQCVHCDAYLSVTQISPRTFLPPDDTVRPGIITRKRGRGRTRPKGRPAVRDCTKKKGSSRNEDPNQFNQLLSGWLTLLTAAW